MFAGGMKPFVYYYPSGEWIEVTDMDTIEGLLNDGMVVIASDIPPRERHMRILFNVMFHRCCDEVMA